MKLSARSRYGARFLLDLAVNDGGRAVSLKDVAARQGISEKYLWQVVNPLKAAGLVEAVRGARGGYRLAVVPGKITVKTLVEVLDGRVVATGAGDEPVGRDRHAAGVMREVWDAVGEATGRAMAGITLHDLAERHRARTASPAMTYDI